MNSRPVWIRRQHLSIFADGSRIGCLALLSLARRLMSPYRRRCHLHQAAHAEVSEIPEDFAVVIENFRIVRIQAIHFEGCLNGFTIKLQTQIRAFELKSTHSL